MSALPDEAGPSNATTIVDPTGDKNTYTVIFSMVVKTLAQI
jgi:hypothetical protein